MSDHLSSDGGWSIVTLFGVAAYSSTTPTGDRSDFPSEELALLRDELSNTCDVDDGECKLPPLLSDSESTTSCSLVVSITSSSWVTTLSLLKDFGFVKESDVMICQFSVGSLCSCSSMYDVKA